MTAAKQRRHYFFDSQLVKRSQPTLTDPKRLLLIVFQGGSKEL